MIQNKVLSNEHGFFLLRNFTETEPNPAFLKKLPREEKLSSRGALGVWVLSDAGNIYLFILEP
jgi:hypothetical protein